MNVLSLFDGMSCGMQALNRAGVKVDSYSASEIDKYAIRVSKYNNPSINHIGDVCTVNGSRYNYTDLLIGGSPCQGFSFAGKQLNFKDERSKLFFEYLRILDETKPKYFLLENVVMKKDFQDVITKYLGVNPIKVNSAYFSVQQRERLYWTNIPIVIPSVKNNTVLRDILEPKEDVLKIVSGDLKDFFIDKNINSPIDKLLHIGNANIKGLDCIKRVYHELGKCPTLTTMAGGNRQPKVLIDGNRWRRLSVLECERAMGVTDGYTQIVSNSQSYKMLGNGWEINTICNFFKNIK